MSFKDFYPEFAEMAEERASCGGWPAPMSSADYLMWIEDEAQVQQDQIDSNPNEASERASYALALMEAAEHIRSLGVVPSTPPWQNPAQTQLVEVRYHQEDEPTSDSEDVKTAAEAGKQFPNLANIIEHPDFVSLEFIVGLSQVIIRSVN